MGAGTSHFNAGSQVSSLTFAESCFQEVQWLAILTLSQMQKAAADGAVESKWMEATSC